MLRRATNKLKMNWIEVHLADHCNLHCRGCTHHSPYLDEAFYPLEQFRRDIAALATEAQLNLLTFLGGEPLLNEQIAEYIRAARQTRIAQTYSVATNGLLLRRASDALFKEVDLVRVSLYPTVKIDQKRLREFLHGKSRQFGFKYDLYSVPRFYDVEVEQRLPDADALYSYQHCDRLKQGHFMDRGFFFKCMRPATTGRYLRNRGFHEPLREFSIVDGVALQGPDLGKRLRDYLTDLHPLTSCYYCRMGFKNEYHGNWYRRVKGWLRKQPTLKNLLYRNRTVLAAYFRAMRSFEDVTGNGVQSAGDIPLRPHELMTGLGCAPRKAPTTLGACSQRVRNSPAPRHQIT